jgi:glycerophosphoryl diester phosphodiesterase
VLRYLCMSFLVGVRSWARLVTLVFRSGVAPRGPRRDDHPFVTGLRAGQVIPHQGGHWPSAQPNTIAAYRQAAPRTQILDIDLWLTADDVLVCSHDDELEPGRRISTTTWAELESTTAVPRFIDVATMFADHRLNVEVKDARALDSIRELIGSSDLADRTCLSTFSPVLARALAGAAPRAAHARPTARRVGRIWGPGDVVQTMTFVPDAAAALGRLKPLLLRVLFSAGSPDLVLRQIPIAEKKGLPLFAWTVNDDVPLRELIAAGADAVLSDQPELFDEPQNTD